MVPVLARALAPCGFVPHITQNPRQPPPQESREVSPPRLSLCRRRSWLSLHRAPQVTLGHTRVVGSVPGHHGQWATRTLGLWRYTPVMITRSRLGQLRNRPQSTSTGSTGNLHRIAAGEALMPSPFAVFAPLRHHHRTPNDSRCCT